MSPAGLLNPSRWAVPAGDAHHFGSTEFFKCRSSAGHRFSFIFVNWFSDHVDHKDLISFQSYISSHKYPSNISPKAGLEELKCR